MYVMVANAILSYHHLYTVFNMKVTVTVLTQVSHSGKAWVEADLLDFVSACQEEVNDPISHNTVGEALDDMMKSSSQV